MLTLDPASWRNLRNFLILLLISVGVKLYASQLLVWEVDYVPVIARGQTWLDGGMFPAVGTLSSVAAYNMPFLTWMQIPVMIFTHDVAVILIGTQLLFNILATWFVYRLGNEMFTPTIGFVGAILFTFSETGLSSSYTAWAQLLLPGFYVMVMYSLFRWKLDNSTLYVAMAWIISTMAFMTHFSAILLYGVIIVLWLIMRFPLNWRGLIIGVVVSASLLSPYMLFEVERDFVDLKAFFTRQTTISSDVLADYAYLKPENQGQSNSPSAATDNQSASDIPTQAEPKPQSSRLERGVAWVLSMPMQVIGGLRLVFTNDLRSLREYYPILHSISLILRSLLEISFWAGIVLAIYRYSRAVQMRYQTFPDHQRLWTHRIKLAVNTLTGTTAGRNLIILLFVLGIIAGLILVRAGYDQQATYYTGLFSLQFVMCAYGMIELTEIRGYTGRVMLLVLLLISLGAFDRITRVANHDVTVYSPFNIALYSSINSATTWIADDWTDSDTITVSYDFMPEMAGQWWVAPWNTIDDSYRMGMAYDYLLMSYHGLENRNTDPIGQVDNADYIVTFQAGVADYDSNDYQIEQFGAIFVLKPLHS